MGYCMSVWLLWLLDLQLSIFVFWASSHAMWTLKYNNFLGILMCHCIANRTVYSCTHISFSSCPIVCFVCVWWVSVRTLYFGLSSPNEVWLSAAFEINQTEALRTSFKVYETDLKLHRFWRYLCCHDWWVNFVFLVKVVKFFKLAVIWDWRGSTSWNPGSLDSHHRPPLDKKTCLGSCC